MGYHRAASYLTEDQLAKGRTFNIVGNDEKMYTLLQVEGEVNDTHGIFEYILNSEGVVTHERFVKGGKITGAPNQ